MGVYTKVWKDSNSILLCETFMRSENIDKLLIVGGSILKNKLDLTPIDDYDIKIIGNKEELINIVTHLVGNKGWKSNGKNIFISGTSSPNSIYSTLISPEPQNYLFDIGYREENNQTQLTPFLLESLTIKLEKEKCGTIKRTILDITPLEQLLSNKLDMMQPIDKPFDLYRIIQRFFVTTIKYDIKEEEKQKIIQTILKMNKTYDNTDDFENAKVNSIRKLFILLRRISQDKRKIYLQELSKTNILQECFENWKNFMDNPKVKDKIIADCNNNSYIYFEIRKIIESNVINLSENKIDNGLELNFIK